MPGFLYALRARDFRLLGNEEKCKLYARRACRINFLTSIVCLSFLALNLYFLLMRMDDIKKFMSDHCDLSSIGSMLGMDQIEQSNQQHVGLSKNKVDAVFIAGYA